MDIIHLFQAAYFLLVGLISSGRILGLLGQGRGVVIGETVQAWCSLYSKFLGNVLRSIFVIVPGVFAHLNSYFTASSISIGAGPLFYLGHSIHLALHYEVNFLLYSLQPRTKFFIILQRQGLTLQTLSTLGCLVDSICDLLLAK